MKNLDNDIYEFNKIDAHNKLKEAISCICNKDKENNADYHNDKQEARSAAFMVFG